MRYESALSKFWEDDDDDDDDVDFVLLELLVVAGNVSVGTKATRKTPVHASVAVKVLRAARSKVHVKGSDANTYHTNPSCDCKMNCTP